MRYKNIYNFLENYIGLDINSISRKCLNSIINRWFEKTESTDSDDFLIRLKNNSDILEEFIDDMTVKETWFFRDKQPYIFLQKYIKEKYSFNNSSINILSLPCSTGEEPYSICISLLEAGFDINDFNIYGIDISKKAIEKAKKGIYRKISFREKYFEDIYIKYFKNEKNDYRINKKIINKINFIPMNLFDNNLNIPSIKFHIIFCRNFIIYLNETAKEKIVILIKKYLINNGLLITGHTETNYFKAKDFLPVGDSGSFALTNNSKLFKDSFIRKKTASDIKKNNNSIKNISVIVKKSEVIPLATELKPVFDLDSIRSLADKGNLTEATNNCEEYLKTNKTDAEVYFLLGTIYGALNDTEKSEKNYLKCLYLNPEHFESAYHLYFLYKQQGNNKKAEVFYKKSKKDNLLESVSSLKA